ncbi:MAG: serine/threonine protein kinase [Polyangiaceae bacterium]|nr:serine/threonine protein kinase [Polyangiaceae bacterium]
MLPPELAATLEMRWPTLAPKAATIAADPRATIVPEHATPDSAGRRALDELTELAARATRDGSLTVEGTLGEGGMGVVHLATQRSLGRKVAVKTLRTEHRNRSATLKLLREAWVTGSLEHPNVLPVYDVALDPEGVPHIVLKRIEGEPWSRLMRADESARARLGVADLLDFNLDVLMQTSRALHFAHSRGILHRDVKPDNVMVGAHGEVYLLDWGIAVALCDDGTGRMPVVGPERELAGTPCYMAPEMLGAEFGELGVASDVYLLGAVLHEVLAGRPPHEGPNAMAIVSSVLLSRPKLGPEVPAELAAIVERAMQPDPAARFPSAEAFRLAVQDFLHQRGSLRLAERAHKRLAELVARLDAPREGEGSKEWRAETYNLFGECRFGFREALAASPELATAQEGLRSATGAMIRYELSAGDARAAASLLAELPDAPAELAGAVERALAEHEERQKRFAALEREHDMGTGQRTRWFLSLVLGLLWTVSPIVLSRAFPMEHGSAWATVGIAAAFLVLVLLLGLWARDSMSKTAINRRVGAAAVIGCASYLALAVGAGVAGLEAQTVVTVALVMWSAIAAMVAHGIDRRMVPTALGYLAAFFVAARFPARAFDAMAGAHLLLTVNVAAIWRPPVVSPRLARLVAARSSRPSGDPSDADAA